MKFVLDRFFIVLNSMPFLSLETVILEQGKAEEISIKFQSKIFWLCNMAHKMEQVENGVIIFNACDRKPI